MMTRKKGSILVAALLGLMTVVVLVGVLFKRGIPTPDSLLTGESSDNAVKTSASALPANGSSATSTATGEAGTSLFQTGTTELCGLRFTAGSYTVTRSGQGLISPWNSDYPLDAGGNLPKGYTFVSIPLTIENISDQAIESSLSNNTLERYVDGEWQADSTIELETIGGSGQANRTTLHYQLEPGKKKSWTVAYVVPEEMLSHPGDWVLKLKPKGGGSAQVMYPDGHTETTGSESDLLLLKPEKKGVTP